MFTGQYLRSDSQWLIMISTTTLVNLMSMMAATVSSSARKRVGPKQTPRLETVIRFLSDLATTLQEQVQGGRGLGGNRGFSAVHKYLV